MLANCSRAILATWLLHNYGVVQNADFYECMLKCSRVMLRYLLGFDDSGSQGEEIVSAVGALLDDPGRDLHAEV